MSELVLEADVVFDAMLECELLDRRRFATKAQARMAIFEFIEG